MNEYVLEMLTRDRLAEMRGEGEPSKRLWVASQASRTRGHVFGDLVSRAARRLRYVLGRSFTTIATGDTVTTERTSSHGGLRG